MHAYRADRPEDGHDPAVRRSTAASRRSPCCRSRSARSWRVRTAEKDGYTRRPARRRHAPRSRTSPSRCAATSPRRRSSRRRKVGEFRVAEDALLEVGAEIHVGHFVAGQFVDVAGVSIGKGFAGAMKRHNFGGLRAIARRLGLAPQPRLDRQPPGPGPGVQGQEDGRPHGPPAGDGAEPRGVRRRSRARPDPGQGRRARARRAARCG